MSTWILLRGLTREARHWGDFPRVLAEAVPGAQPHCIDLPGNGRRHVDTSPAMVAGLLAAVRAEVAVRGLPPPWHLLALSLGGMVAVEWAVRHPHELAGAVLVSTSLRPHSPARQRLRWQQWPALLRLLIDLEGDAAHEAGVLALTSGRSVVPPDWLAWRQQCRVSRRNALRQLVAAARYRAPPTPPALPLLVLAGAGDRLVDPRCSAVLAERWGSTFALHPSAGHDLPLDDGCWVAERVRDWLAASQTATTSAAPSSASI